MDEQLVERVAMQICRAGGYGLCVGFCHSKRCMTAIEQYGQTARAIIPIVQADQIAALEASGRVIVPVEPTEAMVEAGYNADGTGGCHDFDGPAVYRAMLAAAKGQTDGR